MTDEQRQQLVEAVLDFAWESYRQGVYDGCSGDEDAWGDAWDETVWKDKNRPLIVELIESAGDRIVFSCEHEKVSRGHGVQPYCIDCGSDVDENGRTLRRIVFEGEA